MQHRSPPVTGHAPFTTTPKHKRSISLPPSSPVFEPHKNLDPAIREGHATSSQDPTNPKHRTLKRKPKETYDEEPIHAPEGDRRTATNSTQDSKESSGSKKAKQTSNAETESDYYRPTSRQSLPDFLKSRPKLYWPQTPPSANERRLVDKQETVNNPDTAFRKNKVPISGVDITRSEVYAARFLHEDGKDEYLAVKVVLCDADTVSEAKKPKGQRGRNEYEKLVSVDHNHIIAVVGSFTEEPRPGDRQFGIILYPLAFTDLEAQLLRISKHNEARGNKDGDWLIHNDVPELMSYFACLCQALMYLHREFIRHQDVKPANILIDKYGTVMLADFDIAKKYSSREQAYTGSRVDRLTKKYAPKHVKDQKKRGDEWDIYSLGCVFLEMVSVIMGETLTALHKHLVCGREEPPIDWTDLHVTYDEALGKGHVGSWLDYLGTALEHDGRRESIPISRFQAAVARGHYEDISSSICGFLGPIDTMLTAPPMSTLVLDRAWGVYEKFCETDCRHCYPNISVQNSAYRVPQKRFTSPVNLSIPANDVPDIPELPHQSYTDLNRATLNGLMSSGPSSAPLPRILLDAIRNEDERLEAHADDWHENDVILETPAAVEDGLNLEVNGTTSPSMLYTMPNHPGNDLLNGDRVGSSLSAYASSEISRPPEDHGEFAGQGTSSTPVTNDLTSEVKMVPSLPLTLPIIWSTGRQRGLRYTDPALRGELVIVYDTDAGKEVFRTVKKSHISDPKGVIFELSRFRSPKLRVPNSRTQLTSVINVGKVLSVKQNMYRAAGRVRQLYVRGDFERDEIMRTAVYASKTSLDVTR
ncbi:hypothetical protein LTR17_000494 [Elasticomyces elasticus]|nr:hypothetical protein LTR17_000494 [Elasticomyces elasticus]